MKHLSIILVCLCFTVLYAQTQDFPDLNVQGESELRTHLNKHAIPLLPSVAQNDSLPSFIPRGLLNDNPTSKPAKNDLNGYLQLELNAAFGFNSYVSFYPKDTSINAITHRLSLQAPETDLTSLQNRLSIGAELSKNVPLVFRLEHIGSKAQDFKSSVMEFSVTHHNNKLDYRGLRFRDVHFALGLTGVQQEVLTTDEYDSNFALNVSERLVYDNLDVYSKLLAYSGRAGIHIAPRLMLDLPSLNNFRFHILADSYRVLPSLSFLYKTQLTDMLVASVANDPLLLPNNYSELMESTAWLQLPAIHKLQKMPVNLSSSFEFRLPKSDKVSLSSLKLNNNIGYKVHAPVLTQGIVYGVPNLNLTDVSSYCSSLDAFFEMQDFTFKQTFAIELGYLPGDNWHRVGYLPVLGINSLVDYRIKDWIVGFDLKQSYFSKDHLGRNLPESVIANIGVEYHKAETAVYAQVGNLLNHNQRLYSEYPSQKRNIYIGFKHRL